MGKWRAAPIIIIRNRGCIRRGKREPPNIAAITFRQLEVQPNVLGEFLQNHHREIAEIAAENARGFVGLV
jgi:hypothetical protein